MEERKQNYTIMEGHEIPSHGEIYGDGISGHVELRSMTARDEMKRLSYSSTQFKTLADIIEGCMIEKPAIHVYDMALGDYEFLLHKLRVISYGPEYKMSVVCPICGKRFDAIADLDQVIPKPFDLDTFRKLETLTLVDSGDTVKIRFQTPRILDTIETRAKELRRKHKTEEKDFSQLVLLEEAIAEVNGRPLDPAKLDTYIENLSARDMWSIVNRLSELNQCIGVDDTLEFDCEDPDCGESFMTRFRFGPEFLRPTTV